VYLAGLIRKSRGRRGAWSVVANAPVSSGPLRIVGIVINANMDAREDEPLGINMHE
jgi:hypothetical protein